VKQSVTLKTGFDDGWCSVVRSFRSK